MNLRLIILSAMALVVVSCGREASTEEVVGATARLYYESLLEGRYDDYVAGLDGWKEMPPAYREQLRDNAKMFVHKQEKARGGIKSVEVSQSEVDTENHQAQVFLRFCYADSTAEQVVVPMVERDGVWLMR